MTLLGCSCCFQETPNLLILFFIAFAEVADVTILIVYLLLTRRCENSNVVVIALACLLVAFVTRDDSDAQPTTAVRSFGHQRLPRRPQMAAVPGRLQVKVST